MSEHLWRALDKQKSRPDFVCGVPYTALPFATVRGSIQVMPGQGRKKRRNILSDIYGCAVIYVQVHAVLGPDQFLKYSPCFFHQAVKKTR